MVSQLKVNEIIKQSGSSITIGESGDTITLPSTSTLTNFPENTPAFRAYLGSDQSQTANVNTKINYNTVDFNIGSGFDNVNYKFLPNVAGKYYITVAVGIDGADADKYFRAYIYKNGSEYSFSSWGISNDADEGGVGQHSDIVDLNGSTDHIEGYVRYGGTDNITGQTGKTFFSAYKLIGA